MNLDILLPRRCAICHNRLTRHESFLCAGCLTHLHHPVLFEASSIEVLQRLWGKLPIQQGITLCYYHRSSNTHLLLQEMKYKGRIDLCQCTGQLLVHPLRQTDFFQSIDFIVPIPLSRQRQRWRGYNQAEHISKGISKETQIPVLPDLLIRHIDNESQTHKSATERMENVKGIFRVNERARLSRLVSSTKPPHFLVVDDVITTGATVSSAIQTLCERFPDASFSVASIALTKE